MGYSDEDEIVIKNLHDSAWNSPCDVFNDTSSTACELTMLILSKCYIQSDLFDWCIFNYEIVPAKLVNTFLFTSRFGVWW